MLIGYDGDQIHIQSSSNVDPHRIVLGEINN